MKYIIVFKKIDFTANYSPVWELTPKLSFLYLCKYITYILMFEWILKYGSKMIHFYTFCIHDVSWSFIFMLDLKFCHPKLSLREAFGIPLFSLQIYFILEKLKNEEKS